MAPAGRSLFPYVAIVLMAAAVVWAMSFSTLPPADFTFVNGTEIRSVDPARESGQPEGRIMAALFEGLYRSDPKTLEPIPGVAASYQLSDEGRTYTFHIRPEACWTDGTELTAEDFRWSWQRMLHPETESEYAGLLADRVVNGLKYHKADVNDGDPVEVELPDRPVEHELFPRGTMLRGRLVSCVKPPKPPLPEDATSEDADKAEAKWRTHWIYTIEINGKARRFCGEPPTDAAGSPAIEKCRNVLLDFDQVGISAPDKRTFRVSLISPTPYFLYLAAFYPLSPQPRKCIEKYGFPDWTRQENIVTNGAYRLEFRRIRDRIRLRKNPTYWDAANVRLNVIDALAVESNTTGLNMYLDGQVDWCTSVPSYVIPALLKRKDCLTDPSLTIAYYRLNVTKPQLKNPLVRRALNQAIDKETICTKLLRAGQVPARSITPRGLPGYKSALCGEFNPEAARKMLEEAGHPNGKGIAPIEILHNSGPEHEDMAQAIGNDWERHLGISVTYRSLEWGNYLSTVNGMQYTVSRSGWIGDYPDPLTFLDLFLTGGSNNSTGWSNARYDEMIRSSALELDPQRRLQILHDAEQILMNEMPAIPNYSAVSINMVRPNVRGFFANNQDIHPLGSISVKTDEDSPRPLSPPGESR
ncbi:MAG: peptide ABC transporter substrate-binding protein [Planctomycetes bacterium]|nr:peptide ABC transporter substrate-binding protein [Planctomycetota bacterium]